MSKKTDVIISTYKQANADADVLLNYIDSISSPDELFEADLPDVIMQLEDKDSAKARTYIDGAKILGGSVAAAVGATVSRGLLTKGMLLGGSALAGGLGVAMIPGLNLISIPVIALPLALKILADSKIKKYIKANKEELMQKGKKLQKNKEKIIGWINNLQDRAEEIDNNLRDGIKEKFSEYTEKTKKFAKKVSIQIDDCINTNTNKRIQQYNEVILNQYQLQKDLEGKVDYLFSEYNKLLAEKQELERKIACLIRLLSALGCPESVINQALNESEA